MTHYQLKFYADTPTAVNKLFTWSINNRHEADKRLKYFKSKGWFIRAAWLQATNNNVVIFNIRLVC